MLSRWGAIVVAGFCAAVIGFGLLLTLYKGVLVAPHTHEGKEGRGHLHMKNVTRLGGTPEDVASAIRTAVDLVRDLPAQQSGQSVDWRKQIHDQIQPAGTPQHVVALPQEGTNASVWALPGAFWAVYAGSPVVFVGEKSAGAEALATVRKYNAPVYLLAPESVVSDDVLRELSGIRETHRVSGESYAAHAVRIAEYRDERTGFGWGRTQEQRLGYFQYVISAPTEALQAIAALPLARTNACTFLFSGHDGNVPEETDRYIWAQKSDWFTTPSEGPFRHIWVVGDQLSYAAQARLDLAMEKAPYADMGPVAFGPMEALLLSYMAFGVAGAVFVFLHGRRLLREVMLPTRIEWTFTALLLPVLGVVLYFAAYRREKMPGQGNMPMWRRPPSIQSAAATAMGFGFGAPLMIAIGYLFVYFGFPLFFGEWADGIGFLLGAGMPLMMVGMYVGAILLAWPLVQMPMKAMMTGNSPRQVAGISLAVTALSMTAVSLGMMTTSWWMMMAKLPMMPKEDDLLWFGSMWLASSIGFLVAWPLNYPMVRLRMKPGGV